MTRENHHIFWDLRSKATTMPTAIIIKADTPKNQASILILLLTSTWFKITYSYSKSYNTAFLTYFILVAALNYSSFVLQSPNMFSLHSKTTLK